MQMFKLLLVTLYANYSEVLKQSELAVHQTNYIMMICYYVITS